MSMATPSTTRELLIAEAIGDLGRLLDRAETLQSSMAECGRAIGNARVQLADQLAAFEAHIAALTEKAKVQAVKHILVRTDEAARRSIELQSRAMADAARVAFGVELGATMQKLQLALQPLLDGCARPWERWLMHAAMAAAGSAATLALLLYLGPR